MAGLPGRDRLHADPRRSDPCPPGTPVGNWPPGGAPRAGTLHAERHGVNTPMTVVKASGRRWLACMLLVPLSRADRVWALPFLTALCPTKRFYEQRGRRHQPLTARAWQMMRLVVRWLPGREIVLVADSRFAALELLDKVKMLRRGSVITRLRLDAGRSESPPQRAPGTTGRPRLK